MWGKTCLIKHNLWHCILAWDCFYHAQVTLHQQTDVVLFLSRNFCLPVGQGACKREEKKREKENSLSKNIKSNIHTHTRTHNPTNQHLHNLPKVCKKLFSILRIWRKLQNRKYNLEEKLCSFTQNIFFMYQVLLVENESLPSKKLIAQFETQNQTNCKAFTFLTCYNYLSYYAYHTCHTGISFHLSIIFLAPYLVEGMGREGMMEKDFPWEAPNTWICEQGT